MNYYYPHMPYQPNMYVRNGDERFLPFFGLPFLAGGLAGLAVAPFFFNRPYYPPYPPYPPYYQPYGPTPVPYGGYAQSYSPYNVTENINIYPSKY